MKIVKFLFDWLVLIVGFVYIVLLVLAVHTKP